MSSIVVMAQRPGEEIIRPQRQAQSYQVKNASTSQPVNYDSYNEALLSKAEGGDAEAQYALGNCYFDGKGIDQNREKAVVWYTKAANQGHVAAQTDLGYCYYNAVGVSQDYVKAVNWYSKATMQGNVIAENNLGACYYFGYGVEQDYSKAMNWYIKSANKGYVIAQNNTAFCYENGYGVPQNYTKAVEWYIKAAEQGYSDSVDKIIELHQKGHIKDEDYDSEILRLGALYCDEENDFYDYSIAEKCYNEAANLGDDYAMYCIGWLYNVGKPEYNVSEAIEWYTKAAEMGNAYAMEDLGNIYFNKEDYEEALRWYSMAIESYEEDDDRSRMKDAVRETNDLISRIPAV